MIPAPTLAGRRLLAQQSNNQMNTNVKTDVGSEPSRPTSPATSYPYKSSAPLAAPLTIGGIICLGLLFTVWEQHHKHVQQAKQWDQTVTSYSNQVTALDERLAEQAVVNLTLETNLAATQLKASNDLAAIEATLSTTSSSLEKSQAEVKAAEAAIAEKDKQIVVLESQNSELDKQSSDLRDSITNLESQIQETQKKLDADEGDKKVLMAELARLQAQKDELERKLTDLAFLKETVRKLKEDLAIARRLDWIRLGIYDAFAEKGGERLSHPLLAGAPVSNGSLNVELQQNGTFNINPSSTTNSPPDK